MPDEDGAPHRAPPAASMRVLAPAKLNLYLDVTGRRPDGYHALETLFLELPWGDDVSLEVGGGPGVRLVREGPVPVPDGDGNLAVRAARRWLEAWDPAGVRSVGVTVRLHKRIPLGAGLGGGSSDAAAVLSLLERALGPLGPPRVPEIAAGLGADVPFFLVGGAAVGRGRGDELERLPAPPSIEVVLILPELVNETRVVFAHVVPDPERSEAGGLAAAVAALASGDAAALRRAHHNALTRPAMAAYPAFRDLVEAVESRLGRRPSVSGSGSALYDLPDPGEAEVVLARLEGLAARCLLLRT